VQRLEQLVLFPGHLLGAPEPPTHVSGLERMTVSSIDGEVEAWFLPSFGARSGERRPAVVFAHGNGEIIDQWAEELEPYRAMGCGVFLPEYRGYGRCPGTPSESAITEDFVMFYDQLVRRPDVDGTRIVLHGRSLGGGAVCALAKQRPAAGLVLESTFTSIADIARRWFIPPGILTNRFDNEPLVRDFPGPILVLHGHRDRVIPYSHAQELARAARQAKLVTYDCDHNDMARQPDGYWREVESYLKTIVG
jgi:pimeloyl-ACP methyl ester carboxylesterase